MGSEQYVDWDETLGGSHEWLTEYEEDDYPDVDYPEHYFQDPGSVSFAQIYENCIEPVISDALLHIGKLLFWCFVYRISTQLYPLPTWLRHVISCVCGLVCLAHYFHWNALFPVVLAFVAFWTLHGVHTFLHGYRGPACALACIIFNFTSEFCVASSVDWHVVRGAQMILTMKLISLGFDIDEGIAKAKKAKEELAAKEEHDKHKRSKSGKRSSHAREEMPRNSRNNDNQLLLDAPPSFLPFLGYCLCPGNCVFGPWVKYEEYVALYSSPIWNMTWFVKIFLAMVYAMTFLAISACLNPWMIPDGLGSWHTAYRDAMSFRASHYFVSYVSEATAVMAGIGSSSTSEGVKWNLQVVQPVDIELPRSLSEVVKFWNIPMHKWLKSYCFQRVRCYGTATAIFATYFFSTMLHGFYPQIGAVLFSLSVYTYAEHTLRSKLSRIFNASVGPTRPKDRLYRHREGSGPVILVNFAFGLLAAFNLAYLGVMFGQDETMTKGYSIQHTLAKWSELSFVSHGIMLFILVLSVLI